MNGIGRLTRFHERHVEAGSHAGVLGKRVERGAWPNHSKMRDVSPVSVGQSLWEWPTINAQTFSETRTRNASNVCVVSIPVASSGRYVKGNTMAIQKAMRLTGETTSRSSDPPPRASAIRSSSVIDELDILLLKGRATYTHESL